MSESLNRQLAELHAERVATWAPAALQVNIDQRQRLVDEARPHDYVQVGDELDPFTLLNVEGGELNRDLLLADGPAVLVFFRFAGCPACNIALPYYERQLYPRLRELGVPLVAVSPQVPERLVEIKTRHNLQLLVASDPDNNLGRRLGILYSFDEASRNAALAKGNHIGETTGTGTWELPQPTVVVIARDSTVALVDVSPDWLVRTEADPVLRAVEQLLGQQPVRIAI
ncbi:peroxiredoxin-like family protein [Pseudomonas lurida]|uniref:peroxiredoxin-like family protein n=1 Tax=Pseudomonas lurida TaxID=244566 RepID=UPI0017867F12|nr:peroxiredoxin-like family protein [Pseudomonas lurida]MBD8671686.1 AhpC/TSA family protein [Pseudomonas lurida]UZQ74280.1 peroxiredoxin-like family protein [Pseudomonas lurida]